MPLVSLPHGFGLAADLHRRLRGRPAEKALKWVEATLRTSVVNVEALEGGNSSSVHRLTMSGPPSPVVLRRYVLEWTADEPEIPFNEALALGLLDAMDLPAPRLLAADPDGTATGLPTTLMTAVPGSVVWEPDDLESWLHGLVDMVVAIHAQPVSPALSNWSPYAPESAPPPWSRHPEAWEKAVAAYHGPRPALDRVFLHRDYHPGNILWTGDRITGVIDWVSACAGPPEEDIAHCRANLATHHDMATADRFLSLWLSATGRPAYDPYFDLVTAVSMAGDDPLPGLDTFVAAAAELR